MKTSTSTLMQILEILIYQGPQTIEETAKKIGKHYTTAMRRLKEMNEQALIIDEAFARTLRDEPPPANEGPQSYHVTENGLILYFLVRPKEAFARFEEIAEKHAEKFLTFKWYPYFASRGLGEVIQHRFKVALINTRSDVYAQMMLFGDTITGKDEDQLLRFFPFFSDMDRERADRITFGFINFVKTKPREFELLDQYNPQGGVIVSKNPFFTAYETDEGFSRLMDVFRAVDENPELARLKRETMDSYIRGLELMKENVEAWIKLNRDRKASNL
ncbi:MAG: hypothetical protein ABIJ47_14335 [Candidatus Bathyarchaeota archaeon]